MKNVKLKSTSAPAKGRSATPGRGKTLPKTAYGRDEIEEIFRRFSIQRPEPKGELEHVNPFTLVVAVALSAQATDAGVNKATRALFAVADTPQKMVELGEEKVRDYIKTIGLYRNKAKNVIALSEKLIADFGGEVPRTREELITLPGVGRKTANVVMSMAFGEATMAVDTHVFRVSARLGLTVRAKNPLETEMPDGGFYLWLSTPIDDAQFVRRLQHEYNVLALPGSYLAREAQGRNPGKNRVRMALVAPLDECVEGIERMMQFARKL